MTFDVMTLFPELVETVTSESIIGRARKSGAITVRTHNIRDFSKDKHRKVDDTPYGGGMGMLMAAPPIYDCYLSVKQQQQGSSVCVFMSAQGKVLTQKKAIELSKYDNITILCRRRRCTPPDPYRRPAGPRSGQHLPAWQSCM